jgi:hypothetical protein
VELFGALNQQVIVAVAAGALLVLQVASVAGWWLQQRKVRSLDGRVAHLSAAMALLTDTLEGGLHDLAREVSRLSAVAAAQQPVAVPVRNNSAAQRRVRSASKRGRTVREIAVAEEMSEGEVRLMLQQTPGREIKESFIHADVR